MATGRFCFGFALGAAIAVALAGLAVLVDPSAALAERWPEKPQICAPGLRADPRRSLPVLATLVRPQHVLLGSSRVSSAFTREAIAGVLPASSMNLAVSGAQLEEIEALFRVAAASGRLQRAWVGVDFGMFVERNARPPVGPADAGVIRLLGLTLRLDSLLASIAAVWNFSEDCMQARYDSRGFDAEQVRLRLLGQLAWSQVIASSRARLADTFQRAARGADPMSGSAWSALDRIRELARRSGVELILFVNPSHRDYSMAIEKAGLAETHIRWRQRIAGYDSEPDLAVFDFTGHAETLNVDLDHCNPLLDGGCPLYDTHHARPRVGADLMRLMQTRLSGMENW